MKVAPAQIAALALALLAVGGLALGARCASATLARCSVRSLLGDAPALDVPYAVTRPELIERMLDLGEVGPGDRVLDLGSGDGRILRAAARRGASGTGIDIDPVLVAEAQAAADRERLPVRFVAQDLFATPLGHHDVVTMYLLPAVNLRLRPRLLAELAPGARVVSHAFDMGDWRPDAATRVGGARAYLWIIPASVAGRWRLDDGAVLDVHQRFQDVAATLARDGRTVPVADMRLDGRRLRFVADGRLYRGEVHGDTIAGAGWTARRGTGDRGRTARSPVLHGPPVPQDRDEPASQPVRQRPIPPGATLADQG